LRISVLAGIQAFLNLHQPHFGPADDDLDAALAAFLEAEGCKAGLTHLTI